MDNNTETEKDPSLHGYVIEISESLYHKIEKVISTLNKLDNHNHSKRSWAIEAIQEKLRSEEVFPNFLKGKHLNLFISQELNKELEKKVALLKKFRKSYSKKKWIIEALHEKLEREENQAKMLIEKFKELS